VDPWQEGVLRSPAGPSLLLCSRQSGKTTLAAVEAVRTAVLEAPALVLVIAPTERQSGEVMTRVKDLYAALSRPRDLSGLVVGWHQKRAAEAGKDGAWLALPPKARETALQLHLANGSRIIGLPASERTVRVYSAVSLLVIDEAARVPDELYRSVRPMLAVSRGRLLAATTPFGQRGWFFEEWTGNRRWRRLKVPASRCPRIDPQFLAEERQALGDRWYKQEYECSFEAAAASLFSWEDLQASVSPGLKPMELPE
jgi:hypothetical protein